jgi:hypothetical protein
MKRIGHFLVRKDDFCDGKKVFTSERCRVVYKRANGQLCVRYCGRWHNLKRYKGELVLIIWGETIGRP